MKNCDPLVFGPEFAIDKIPALLWVKSLNSSANLSNALSSPVGSS
jgi:hypothetical protein